MAGWKEQELPPEAISSYEVIALKRQNTGHMVQVAVSRNLPSMAAAESVVNAFKRHPDYARIEIIRQDREYEFITEREK